MLGVATVVFLGAVAMLVVAWCRRDRPGLPFFGEREDLSQGLVLVFGIAVPLVALVALFGVSDVYLVGQTAPPNPRSTRMTIAVIGHQWWWEVRYPAFGVATANEIHIPAGERVRVVVTTDDVIHSFWVPELNRKIDTIPGRHNEVLLDAEHPGVFRGQCAEFCGLQHAHMSLLVYAHTPARFDAWLAAQAKPAGSPTTAFARQGRDIFLSEPCADCHQIRGTSADARVGPDLTHVASRQTLAAVTITNTPSDLAGWIRDPQHVKPGNRMPAVLLSGTQIRALVAYLDSLR
jgi:cytochrome c oxidase subunit 2